MRAFPVTSPGNAGAVATAVGAGEAVNLKAPRMGGPLELLRGLDLAVNARDNYFGGMFEVNVGRAQARQLAALFCGDAPNDLALNLEQSNDRSRPLVLRRWWSVWTARGSAAAGVIGGQRALPDP